MVPNFAPKRFYRFSLATLLFAMLCLGGYLSGYRVGFDDGKQEGVNQLVAAVNRPSLILKSYSVGDLVTSPATSVADFDSLIDAIVMHVSPSDWMESGLGEGEIQPFPTNLSLIISQTEANHQAVAALLEQMRQAQRTNASASEPAT